MDTKLTLKLDTAIIERAKSYAKTKNMSLSKLIENHLDFLTDNKEKVAVTPFVKSLSGTIPLNSDYDYKESYKDHLSKKYMK
ncbi:DUF6364 family protein [Mucilaginibacter arboris]|nr:DUF6364 family protein [Mucilaginibacter arboris]